jgi:hypothetical protein
MSFKKGNRDIESGFFFIQFAHIHTLFIVCATSAHAWRIEFESSSTDDDEQQFLPNRRPRRAKPGN